MEKLTIERIKADALRDGGATYTAKGDAVALSRGYVVSLDYVGIVTTFARLSAHDVRKIKARAKKYGGFVGVWLDEKTGLLYLDVSQVYDDEKRAELFARANRQFAYYDASRAVSVYLD